MSCCDVVFSNDLQVPDAMSNFSVVGLVLEFPQFFSCIMLTG